MGWAAQRANGTYREWRRWDRPLLRDGETLVELDECPSVTTDGPDGQAFIAAVMAVFGTPARIKAVWIKQPVWYPAALKENWPFVEAFTLDALACGDITQAEYDGIKAAAIAHHIPITL